MIRTFASTALRSTGLAFRAPTTIGAVRSFGGYEGKVVSDDELVKKSDDWVIEETNFCLGRVSNNGVRFRETDDIARRTLHLIDAQLTRMHTRLRDGTCIPVMGFYPMDVIDRPAPAHTFFEGGLMKWTWDETYDEAFEEPEPPKPAKKK
uniref:Uncharacterized protein n=1 Tax=Chromera velia CCMP2878 TaxID=1169474 RepID=A0A0G4IB57_9ALVE|mmetsp:Transcript_14865/g.29998  ORF Transcript_14865/g.29998 Transcript_14865/m.29998 type:complete len:150 (-) Transcript_14865:519-968(-)|eukprot:Cvel_12741.t1-p1 / transcript=Cvel_12741.t1 / gene=Cvel_12741 / organism=Chromera_velia_CCMP2878 / gene_product=hypothetical protein / transcript_product=hypothetical protein / location=Cvel_scaffold846:63043-63728(-) / protein_length=149 / sequence_SO=supercontig / SO=protein_coding / is_pseudo=false